MKGIMDYVNGRFEEVDGQEKYDVFNPAFGEKIAFVREAKREEIDRAIDGASEAQKKWQKVPISDRIKLLFRLENLMWNRLEEIA